MIWRLLSCYVWLACLCYCYAVMCFVAVLYHLYCIRTMLCLMLFSLCNLYLYLSFKINVCVDEIFEIIYTESIFEAVCFYYFIKFSKHTRLPIAYLYFKYLPIKLWHCLYWLVIAVVDGYPTMHLLLLYAMDINISFPFCCGWGLPFLWNHVWVSMCSLIK